MKCRPAADQAGNPCGQMIYCPGCRQAHFFDHRWQFNGDSESPTFTPSMLCRKPDLTPEQLENGQVAVCHSFVTDGRIQFLGDCTHALANQTVDLEDFPEDW